MASTQAETNRSKLGIVGVALLLATLVVGLLPGAMVDAFGDDGGAQPGSGPVCVDLLAGGQHHAGEVCVDDDGEYLTVTLTTAEAWLLAASHIAVSADEPGTGQWLDQGWQNRAGIPAPGRFPYGQSHDPDADESVTISIALGDIAADLGPGDTLYLAAHADVQKEVEDDLRIQDGAWAAGELFRDRGSWAMWFTYVLQDPVDPPELGSISGEVTDAETGEGIANATVAGDGLSATTDAEGEYTIEDVEEGSYDLVASAEGYEDSDPVTVPVGEGEDVTDVDFALEALPGSISGTVESDGSPLEGAIVTANGLSTETASNGSYTIVDVPPGDYTVTADHEDHEADSQPVSVGPGDDVTGVDFDLEPLPGSISGTVLGDGEPLEGATVTANGHSTQTEADGSYTISDLAPDTYTVTASHEGYEADSQDVPVGPNQDVTGVDFDLEAVLEVRDEALVWLQCIPVSWDTGDEGHTFTGEDVADDAFPLPLQMDGDGPDTVAPGETFDLGTVSTFVLPEFFLQGVAVEVKMGLDLVLPAFGPFFPDETTGADAQTQVPDPEHATGPGMKELQWEPGTIGLGEWSSEAEDGDWITVADDPDDPTQGWAVEDGDGATVFGPTSQEEVAEFLGEHFTPTEGGGATTIPAPVVESYTVTGEAGDAVEFFVDETPTDLTDEGDLTVTIDEDTLAVIEGGEISITLDIVGGIVAALVCEVADEAPVLDDEGNPVEEDGELVMEPFSQEPYFRRFVES